MLSLLSRLSASDPDRGLEGSQPASSPAPLGSVWSASAVVRATPSELLAALTEPQRIARWTPVEFEIEQLEGRRLSPGCHARIRGAIAGRQASFDVDVLRADHRALELRADGPVTLDVAYRFSRAPAGVRVQVQVTLRRRSGLTAQVVRAATAALLSAGVLGTTLARLEASL